jgi:hypothetical protein
MSGHVGFVVDKVVLGQAFSEGISVSPVIFIRPPSSVFWGWYSRPAVAAVPSGLSLTPLRVIIILVVAETL